MADTIIAASVQVNTGNSNAEISQVQKGLRGVKSELTDTSKAAHGTAGSFNNIKSQLGAMPGPLGNTAQGVGHLNQGFKALLANPIGLVIAGIVAALTLLYRAFTSTAEGADTVEKVFAGVSAVVEVLMNRIAKIANSIILLFQGKWKEAAMEGRAAFVGMGDDIVNEFNKAYEGTALMQEVEDSVRSLSKTRAQLNRDLVKSKELLSDENASLKDKVKALKEVEAAETKQTEAELANARKKLEAIKLIKGSRDLSDEDMDELTAAENEITQLEEKSARDRIQINRQKRTMERQANAEARQRDQEERQKHAEYTSKLSKLQQENELLQIKDAYQKELKQLELKLAEDKRANAQAYRDKKITRAEQQKLDEAQGMQYRLSRAEAETKHNEETAKKEADFQRELTSIQNKIRLDGIKDSREAERVQLQIGYEEKLQDAIVRYKDDAIKFQEIKNAIDEQLRQDKAKLDEKNAQEDAKKALDKTLAEGNEVVGDPDVAYDTKKAILDAEQIAIDEAFANKILSEEAYTAKSKELSKQRIEVDQAEKDAKLSFAQSISNSLLQLADVFGKHTKAGKAAAITGIIAEQAASVARIIMSTQAANAKAVAASPLTGGQPFVTINTIQGAISAAAAIAAGVKAVKEIGGSGGGASASMPAPSAAQPAPITPQQTSTALVPSTISGIGDATQNRSYILDADIQNNEERNARLNRAARLGG